MDSFGAITLPIATPATGEAVSDPALNVLLAFCKAVANAECNAAWAVRAPGESPIVRATNAHNPELFDFVDRDVPGLFAWRDNGGTYEDDGIDLHRENGTVKLRWVGPMTTQVPKATRDPILNGLSKALAKAIMLGRHPSWVVDSDLANNDALRIAAATSTSAQTISGAGFNGVLGNATIHAARPVSFTTTASVGAYNTTDPIVVTMLLANGREHEESIYLTNANGGETVVGIWPAGFVAAVDIPAQLTTNGTIAIGYADSPEVVRGSLVKRFAGLSRLELVGPGRRNTMTIQVRDADPLRYPTIDFELRVQEIVTFDMVDDFDSFDDADDAGAGQGPLPVFIEIIHPEPDGEVIEQAYFPDA